MKRIYSVLLLMFVGNLGNLSDVMCMGMIKINNRLEFGVNDQMKMSLVSDGNKVSSGMIRVVDKPIDSTPLSSEVFQRIKKNNNPSESGLLKTVVLQEMPVNKEMNEFSGIQGLNSNGEKFERYEENKTTPETKTNNASADNSMENSSKSVTMEITEGSMKNIQTSGHLNSDSTSTEMKQTTSTLLSTDATNPMSTSQTEATIKIDDSIVSSPKSTEANKMKISNSMSTEAATTNIDGHNTETNTKLNTDHVTMQTNAVTTSSFADAKSTTILIPIHESMDAKKSSTSSSSTKFVTTESASETNMDISSNTNGVRRLRKALNTDQTTIANSISAMPEINTSTSKASDMASGTDMGQGQNIFVTTAVTTLSGNSLNDKSPEMMTSTPSHMTEFTMSNLAQSMTSKLGETINQNQNHINTTPSLMSAQSSQVNTMQPTHSTQKSTPSPLQTDKKNRDSGVNRVTATILLLPLFILTLLV